MLQIIAIIVFTAGISMLCLLNRMRKSYWRSIRDHHRRFHQARGTALEDCAEDIDKLERTLRLRKAELRKLEQKIAGGR